MLLEHIHASRLPSREMARSRDSHVDRIRSTSTLQVQTILSALLCFRPDFAVISIGPRDALNSFAEETTKKA